MSSRCAAIELKITRHEQAAAFMAATSGRVTGKPGVCIATIQIVHKDPFDDPAWTFELK